MALTGDFRDIQERKYADKIEMELQQRTSVLRNLVDIRSGINGSSYAVRTLGQQDGVEEVTTKFQLKNPGDTTAELRIMTPQLLFKDVGLSRTELNTTPDISQDVVNMITSAMGRKLDKLIANAFGASVVRELGGTAGTVSFDSNNTIAYDNVDFAQETVTVHSLHEGKLENAKVKLGEANVDEPLFVLATPRQLSLLSVRLRKLNILDVNKIGKAPLALPGFSEVLSGYGGFTFIAYQGLADADMLSSGKEFVYVFPKSAIKLGIWEDITTQITESTVHVGNPIILSSRMHVGAVRSAEAKVVRMLCATS